jgi:hypothetical protein
VRFTLRITHSNNTSEDVSVGMIDQVAFEKENNRSMAELANDFRVSDMAWLAWHGSKTAGLTTANFETWLADVDHVEIVEDSAGMAPLETVQPTG